MLTAGHGLAAPDARAAVEAEGDGEPAELSGTGGEDVADADRDGLAPYGVP